MLGRGQSQSPVEVACPGLVADPAQALDILGATALLSTIMGAAGIVGLAIGFAVRDTVENFIASMLLSIRQPFRPNDAIEIEGVEGKVIRLTSRATILLNWVGNHVRIRNATVYKSRILNYSRNPERRFSFDIGVGYGTDLAAAKTLAEATVAALPFLLKTPAVNSWTTTLNGSDIGMTVVGWIDQTETDLLVDYDETGNIGKRYRRQDEIGTPFCFTVDPDSVDDGSVTVRDRDTTEQDRIAIADVVSWLSSRVR